MTMGLLVMDEWRHLWRNLAVRWMLLLFPVAVVAVGMGPIESLPQRVWMATMALVQVSGLIVGSVVVASLISDFQQGVPILLVVRPVGRVQLLVARALGMGGLMLVAMVAGICLASLLIHLVEPNFKGLGVMARGAISLGIMGSLEAAACGTLLGVLANSIPSGIFGFLILGNNLILGSAYAAEALPRWTGCSPLVRDGVMLTGGILVAFVLITLASCRFQRRPM